MRLTYDEVARRRNDMERAVLAQIPSPNRINELFAQHERRIYESVMAVASVPRYGTNSHTDCLFAMVNDLGIKVERQQGVFWDQCLTRTIELVISRGYEFVLTLDHDTIFSPADVVTLWTLLKANLHIDALCACQVARERNQPLLMHTDETGEFWRPIPEEDLASDTIRLKTAHFGLTMLRCRAFSKLTKPWFLAIPDDKGGWDAGHLDSDIAFWQNWWEHRNTLYQANHVVIGHAQELISWPGNDLKPIHQYMNDFRSKGKPKESLNYKEPSDG
jgi:hypothetical protein